MAILPVLTYPDPFLKTVAAPVTVFDEALDRLSADMIETMYDEPGIGLAATQVGSGRRLFVMDVGYQKDDPAAEKRPLVVINPQINSKSGESTMEEGCLSVPDFRAEITRAARLCLHYQDLQGAHRELEAEGLQAICIQHEVDHLDGRLFIDHLPPLKRKMVQTRLKKLARRKIEQP
jgi:peptide deformylase